MPECVEAAAAERMERAAINLSLDSSLAGNVIRITLSNNGAAGAARHEYEERMGKRVDPRKCKSV